MDFKVLSKAEIESTSVQSKLTKKHIVLSISDTTDSIPLLPLNRNRLNTFYMFFDDIDKETEGIKSYQPFHKLQAESLLVFINGMLEVHKDLEQIVVHCFAGVSRSIGMASALSFILDKTDTKIFKSGIPNMRVYNMIIKEYYDTPNVELVYPAIAEYRKGK